MDKDYIISLVAEVEGLEKCSLLDKYALKTYFAKPISMYLNARDAERLASIMYALNVISQHAKSEEVKQTASEIMRDLDAKVYAKDDACALKYYELKNSRFTI